MRLKRWQTATLIVLQLLFAACATSVLIYNAAGWAMDVIDFGWRSYRAFNIYVSLALIGYFIWGLARQKAYVLPVFAAFSLFHLADGIVIGFWTKTVVFVLTLAVLTWVVCAQRRLLPACSGEQQPDESAAELAG